MKNNEFRWHSIGFVIKGENENNRKSSIPKTLNMQQVKEVFDLGFTFYHPAHHIEFTKYEQIKQYII